MGNYTKNISSNFITQIIKILLSFITSIIVVRSLGAEKNGYIVYFMLILNLLSDYGHLGINNANIYFEKRSEYLQKEVFNVNISYLIINSIIIGIFFVLLKFNNVIFKEYNFLMILGGVILIAANLILSCISGTYIADERISELNRATLIYCFINSILIIMLNFFEYLNVYTYFIVRIITVITNLLLLISNIKIKFKFQLNYILLKSEIKYGIWLYLATLFIYLNYRCDQFIVKNILGITQLGIYSLGVTLAELLLVIPQSVQTAFTGKLYNIREDNNERNKITAITIKFTFYVTLILVILGLFMTKLIPIIYGNEFKDASIVTGLLFIGLIFISIAKVSYPYYNSKGTPRIHMIYAAITLILNTTLNMIFIPKLGINGAAIASTLSYIFYGFMYIYTFIKKEKFKISDFFYISEHEFKKIIKFKLVKDEQN